STSVAPSEAVETLIVVMLSRRPIGIDHPDPSLVPPRRRVQPIDAFRTGCRAPAPIAEELMNALADPQLASAGRTDHDEERDDARDPPRGRPSMMSWASPATRCSVPGTIRRSRTGVGRVDARGTTDYDVEQNLEGPSVAPSERRSPLHYDGHCMS